MRGTLIRLMVALSVLLAGLHAPAFAQGHDEVGVTVDGHYHDHAVAEDRSDQKQGSAGALGSEALHHHHCPLGLTGVPAELAATALTDCAVFLSGPVKALASLATAPPLEPPLA